MSAHRRRRVRVAAATTGALALLAYYSLPLTSAGRAALCGAIAFVSAAAVLLAKPHVDRGARRGWLLLAMAMVVFAAADTFRMSQSSWYVWSFHAADAVHMAGYLLAAAAVFAMARGLHPLGLHWIVVDATFLAVGAAALTWETLVEPHAHGHTAGPLAELTVGSRPVLDTVLLVLVVTLVLASRRRTPHLVLIAAGIVAMLVTDVVYVTAPVYASGNGLDAGWLLSYLLIGGAALSRSAPRPRAATDARPALAGQPWSILLAAAAATGVGAQVLDAAHGPPDRGVSYAVGFLLLFIVARFAAVLGTLDRAERRFAAMAERAWDLVAIHAADGTILYESPSTLRILGYRPEELVGRNGLELVHPDDVGRIAELLREGVQAGIAETTTELRLKHKAGHYIDVETTGRNLLHDPAVRGIVVISRDVSTRVAAERRLQDLAAQVPDVIYRFRVRPEAAVEYVNPAVTGLVGYTPEELYADPGLVARIVDSDYDLLARRMRKRRTARLRVRRRDGRRIWVEHQSVPLAGAGGETVAIEGVVRDVTASIELEREVRRSMQLETASRLAGGVAHELNNLLQIIVGYARLLERDAAGDAATRIREAGERGARSVAQLLAVSRQRVLAPEPVELADAVRRLLPSLRASVPGASLDVELDAAVPDALVDARALEEAIRVLVRRAGERAGASGRVRVRARNARKVPATVELVVSDTGARLDDDARLRLFEPFAGVAGIADGGGLELPSVYGLVTQSGGTISVEDDEAETAVVVRLPAARLDHGSTAVTGSARA